MHGVVEIDTNHEIFYYIMSKAITMCACNAGASRYVALNGKNADGVIYPNTFLGNFQGVWETPLGSHNEIIEYDMNDNIVGGFITRHSFVLYQSGRLLRGTNAYTKGRLIDNTFIQVEPLIVENIYGMVTGKTATITEEHGINSD